MAMVTNEILYEELLKLDASTERLVSCMEETVAFARETNRLIAEGQARIAESKKRLFGDRLGHRDAAE